MRTRRTRLTLVGVLALVVSLTAGLAVSADAAKKKKKSASSFSKTVQVNAAIPDAPVAAGPSTPVRSSITLGKKFKGKVVSDVNVSFQTTGSAAGAASDLSMHVTAPNGRTVVLWEALGSISIGPVTLDDDTQTGLCDSATPTCTDPDATLLQPFAGRANTMDADDDMRPLSTFDGVPMKGTWTFTIYDFGNTLTSTLNSWGLEVKGVTAPK